MSKTVVFGPWIGELGWELNSWQGWIHRLMRTEYKDYRKIICSFPGRESLYAGCLDQCEYHSLPAWFCNLKYSPRAFGTDYWWKDSPKFLSGTYNGPIMKPMAEKLVDQISQELRVSKKNFILPWETRVYEKFTIGGIYNISDRYPIFNPQRIPKSCQDIFPLTPTPDATRILHDLQISQGIDPTSKLILLFPRNRQRGASKNWPQKYYTDLSHDVAKHYPGYTWAVVGHPSQAFFNNPSDIPKGWLDLINLKDLERQMLNIHIAAMSNAILGVGPASGIIHVATWCKVPVILNGPKRIPVMFTKDENPFGSFVACADKKAVEYKWILNTCMQFMKEHGY